MRKFAMILMVAATITLAGCNWLCCDPCEEDCCGCASPCAAPAN